MIKLPFISIRMLFYLSSANVACLVSMLLIDDTYIITVEVFFFPYDEFPMTYIG